MRYFIDTEFIEDGRTIDLVSIAIVAEDERWMYLETIMGVDYDPGSASDWVKKHVLTQLRQVGTPKPLIRQEILRLCDPEHGKPEFWGYYADYDWVALCQLFGTMMDLPKGWPMYCREIKQWCDMLGNPKLPEQSKGEHNSLADARWNKVAWEFLKDISEGRVTVPRNHLTDGMPCWCNPTMEAYGDAANG